MERKTLWVNISDAVDEDLLLQNESWAAQNRLLRHQSNGRLQISDAEHHTSI